MMKYRILGFQMIPRGALEPHPDAEAFPADGDDRDIVRASVGECGVLQPLIVAAKPAGGGWWVLDGVGRLLGSQAEELPCLTVECGDPRSLAMNINSAGRKRSTGSRVLCYLMANRAAVMKAAAAADQQGLSSYDDRPPRRNSRNEVPDDLKPWGVRAIAARLGVADKDVTYALDLLRCHEKGIYPSVAVHGRYAPGTPIEDDDALESLRQAFHGVMSGRLPVRRWPAGFAGRVNTAGEGGRAATDYTALAMRTAVSLQNVFSHWADVPMRDREDVLAKLEEALRAAPDDVRALAKPIFGESSKRK